MTPHHKRANGRVLYYAIFVLLSTFLVNLLFQVVFDGYVAQHKWAFIIGTITIMVVIYGQLAKKELKRKVRA